MAQGFLGNTLVDNNITIPIEDYQDYIALLKGRQIIVDTIERNGGISVLEVLSAMGGAKASKMYADLIRGYKAELGADDSEQD